MSRLLPCPTCSRHVHLDERACPFCQGVQPVGRVVAPIHRRADFHAKRLGRAALFVGSAALAGCGASTGLENVDPEHDAGRQVLGADSGPDAGPLPFDASFDAGFDAGSVIAAYGAPVPIDAGPVDAGPDAGRDAGEPGAPPYGAPSADAGFDAGSPFAPLYGGPSFFDAGPDAASPDVPAYGAPVPVPWPDAGEEDAAP